MIKEKYMSVITIVCMIIAVLLTTTIVVIPKNQSAKTIQSQEYMTKIFDKDKVMQININISDGQWQSLLEKAGDNEYLICDVIINGETFSNVGIRAKGNSSLTTVKNNPDSDRFSFRIEFDKYIDGQSLYGLKSLVLNGENSDNTYMKEYLSYEMWNEIGINTPGYAYANIDLNGNPWGLYLAVEVLDETFLERNYGINYGNLYKPESAEMGAGGAMGAGGGMPPMNAEKNNVKNANEKVPAQDNNKPIEDTSKTKEDKTISENDLAQVDDQANARLSENKQPGFGGGGMGRMGGMGASTGTSLVYTDDKLSSYSGIFDYTITKTTSTSDNEKVIKALKNLNSGTDIEKYVDVEEVLKYFAVNTFLVNLDSYAGALKHNYYLYEENEKIQILPWDVDLSFGAFQMSDSSKVINFPIDTPVTDNGNSPLIEKLLEVEEYKALYHKYLQELIDKYITSGKFDETVNALDTLISKYVENDATSLNGYDKYKASLGELKTFAIDRTESITQQLEGKQPSTSYGNLETSINLTALGSMGMGDGDRGVGGMGNMPPMENMQKVMSIVQNASDREFTIEEKEQLKNLGVEDTMLDTIKNMGGGMPFGGGPSASGNNSNAISQVINIVFCCIVMAIGILFVMKFNRRKYRSH